MIIKLSRLLLIILSVIFLQSYASAEDWKELKSEHFIVYFVDDDNFAEDVLEKSEFYYQRIASELGYQRYSDFWTWEKRAKIYVYPDHPSFLTGTNQPKWAHGMADYRSKKIISYVWSAGFLDNLLPHEMAHLIFRDFIGFKGEVPLWLDEGVAQWLEQNKQKHVRQLILNAYNSSGLLTIEDMMKLDIRKVTSNDRIYVRSTQTKEGEPTVLFLSGDRLVNTYYLQAASLVGFLIEKYGSNGFIDFCRQLREGKSLEEALKSAYPGRISSLEEFQRKWWEFVEEEVPEE